MRTPRWWQPVWRRDLLVDGLRDVLPGVHPEQSSLWGYRALLMVLANVDREAALETLSALHWVERPLFEVLCADVGVDPADVPDSGACGDCAANVMALEEYGYMVAHDVWAAAGDPPGYLCVGCLEVRLGRRLRPEDFADFLLSTDDRPRSLRLLDRMGRA